MLFLPIFVMNADMSETVKFGHVFVYMAWQGTAS